MGIAPGFAVELDYTAGTGRVGALVVTNTTGKDGHAEARLEDGRVFGQVFGQGSTSVNIPNNVVTLTLDAQGEPTFGGLAGVGARIPA